MIFEVSLDSSVLNIALAEMCNSLEIYSCSTPVGYLMIEGQLYGFSLECLKLGFCTFDLHYELYCLLS